MRVKILILLGLLNFTWVASPLAGPVADDAYLAKFHPVQAPESSGLILKAGDRLAICGDSITEQKMYSRIIEDYLTMCAPQLNISVRQYGWSGEKADGFLSRMTNDCLRFDPTVATTCYGMNDCEYRAYDERIGQTYDTNMTAVVDAFKAHGVKVILGSPGCISKVPFWANPAAVTLDDLDLNLCQLRNIDVKIAREENVRFADVFWPMLTAGHIGRQEYGANYGIPGNDGVHPHWAGHLIMAYAFLTAMGLDGDIGTFTIDLKRNKIKVSEGHRVISAKDGRYEIESFRYPFCPCGPDGQAAASYPVCGRDDVNSDNSLESGMTLVPFNQRLNRLMLVVKGTDAKRYKITWGDDSEIFTAEQLNRGINLAQEFPANPFSGAFSRVDMAIAAKQAYETFEIKSFFRGANSGDSMEAVVAQTDKVVGEAEKERDGLVAAIRAAYAPVTHVIEINAE